MVVPRVDKRLISLLAALLLVSSYLLGLEAVLFHGDEASWISGSYIFEDFFGLQFSSPHFNESYTTLAEPPLPRYLVGLGRRIGGYRWQDLNAHWNWNLDAAGNTAAGNMPSAGLLWLSRLMMAFLAALAIMIGYGLTRAAAGQLAGVIWIALCCLSPYLLLHLRRATAESSLLICIMVAALACWQVLLFLERPVPQKPWRLFVWLALFSAAAGAGGQAKLNGLSVLLAGTVLVILVGIKSKGSVTRKIGLTALAALTLGVSSFIAFVGLNPYLWPDPIQRTLTTLDFRVELLEGQQVGFPQASISGLDQRIRLLPVRILGASFMGTTTPGLLLNILLALTGAIFLLRRLVSAVAQRVSRCATAAILLVGVAAAAPALLTPLDWPRYYLLPVIFITMLTAVGLATLAHDAARYAGEIRKRVSLRRLRAA